MNTGKEETISHKVACVLHSKTLSKGDILSVMTEIGMHSDFDKFSEVVLEMADNIKHERSQNDRER